VARYKGKGICVKTCTYLTICLVVYGQHVSNDDPVSSSADLNLGFTDLLVCGSDILSNPAPDCMYQDLLHTTPKPHSCGTLLWMGLEILSSQAQVVVEAQAVELLSP
jgi:hypothetical protein